MSLPPSAGFHPGARVVCIHDRFPPEARPCFASLPRLHHLYTIQRVGPGHHWRTGSPCLQVVLEECPPLTGTGNRTPGFLPGRFRLLTDHTARMARHSRQRHRSRQSLRNGLPGPGQAPASKKLKTPPEP